MFFRLMIFSLVFNLMTDGQILLYLPFYSPIRLTEFRMTSSGSYTTSSFFGFML